MENSIIDMTSPSNCRIAKKTQGFDMKAYVYERRLDKFFRYKLHFNLYADLMNIVFRAKRDQLEMAVSHMEQGLINSTIAVFSQHIARKYEETQV